MVKKNKIPKAAVKPLIATCETWNVMYGKEKNAAEYFEECLGLMNKYADYFFSEPWPETYDRNEATCFSDADLDFVFECTEEFSDRLTTVCLKKNMSLDGFEGYYGVRRTRQAFYEEFFRPLYVAVIESFQRLVDLKDARKILDKLMENNSAPLIHSSLIDWLEHDYPDKATKELIKEMFILLHEEEGLKPCGYSRCEWYWRENYSPKSSTQKNQEQP